MKIDEQVEPLVREALDAAVKRDLDRFEAALEAFDDDAKRRDGLALVFAIARLALQGSYEGRTPTDEQVHEFADYIAETESWAALPPEEVHKLLRWLLGDDSAQVDSAELVSLAFVVTASMVSGLRRPEGHWWFDTLDALEAALEALPEPAA